MASFSIAAMSIKVVSVLGVKFGGVLVEGVKAFTVSEWSCDGKNSAMRSAVVAKAVTSSIFVLARMERMLTGNVFKKNRRSTASVLSKVKPSAFRSPSALAKKADGLEVPNVWALKYLLNISDLGS